MTPLSNRKRELSAYELPFRTALAIARSPFFFVTYESIALPPSCESISKHSYGLNTAFNNKPSKSNKVHKGLLPEPFAIGDYQGTQPPSPLSPRRRGHHPRIRPQRISHAGWGGQERQRRLLRQPQQVLERDHGVEIAVRLRDRLEMTAINERRLCRNTFGSPDGRNLAIHLGLNVAANLMLASDLNESQGTPRLELRWNLRRPPNSTHSQAQPSSKYSSGAYFPFAEIKP